MALAQPPVQRRGKAVTPDRATAYARAVLAGEIVTGRLVRLACQRHLDDLDDPRFRWDPQAAEKALNFFALVRHWKGHWAGEPVVPEPWQCFVVGSLSGWYLANDKRRFRKAFTEVAKKNGKTLTCAVVGLLRAFFNGEAGAEVYSAATKRDQARLLFNDAVQFVRSSPALKGRISIRVGSLFDPRTSSVFRPLGADTDSEDGLNPSTALIDEVHRHKNRDLIDWMSQSFGARENPLLWMITTAGTDGESVWADEHDYAVRVLENTSEDEALFVFLANLDEGDDPFDEKVWPKANPNLGVSVGLDDMRQAALEAREKPSTLGEFLRLRLNVRASVGTRAFDLARWDAGNGAVSIAEGEVCYGGLDLATVRDLTALVLVFPRDDGSVDELLRFWCPEEGIRERARRDKVPYDVWQREGLLKATEGNITDYDVIREDIRELSRSYEIREIAYDPWNATQLATQLMADGAQMFPLPQGYAHLNAPTKLLEGLVLSGKRRDGNHPIQRWMAGNAVFENDAQENVKPSKKRSTERIDGVVSEVMALSRHIAHMEPETSVYDAENRGFLEL
ncbi:MAG: terminase large subunit [Gemmatimonadetes bacterium]|nr:terminase large subunit [Gemmatimonadota bacterium]